MAYPRKKLTIDSTVLSVAFAAREPKTLISIRRSMGPRGKIPALWETVRLMVTNGILTKEWRKDEKGQYAVYTANFSILRNENKL